MATSKTLTPTNQAITLAEFTEKPDNRVNVNNDSKLADAINALNSKFSTVEDKTITRASGTTYFEERNGFKARREGNLISIFFLC